MPKPNLYPSGWYPPVDEIGHCSIITPTIYCATNAKLIINIFKFVLRRPAKFCGKFCVKIAYDSDIAFIKKPNAPQRMNVIDVQEKIISSCKNIKMIAMEP